MNYIKQKLLIVALELLPELIFVGVAPVVELLLLLLLESSQPDESDTTGITVEGLTSSYFFTAFFFCSASRFQ